MVLIQIYPDGTELPAFFKLSYTYEWFRSGDDIRANKADSEFWEFSKDFTKQRKSPGKPRVLSLLLRLSTTVGCSLREKTSVFAPSRTHTHKHAVRAIRALQEDSECVCVCRKLDCLIIQIGSVEKCSAPLVYASTRCEGGRDLSLPPSLPPQSLRSVIHHPFVLPHHCLVPLFLLCHSSFPPFFLRPLLHFSLHHSALLPSPPFNLSLPPPPRSPVLKLHPRCCLVSHPVARGCLPGLVRAKNYFPPCITPLTRAHTH